MEQTEGMSPRTAVQNAQIRDERRDEILEAALGVFARRGLEATRIADIAEAAGMSHGLVYRYFPSKEAVFMALVERAVRGGVTLTEEAVSGSSSSPGYRLKRLIQQMLDGIETHPEYSLIIIQFYAASPAPLDSGSLIDQYDKQTQRNVARLIRFAQNSLELRDGNPDELATLLLATVQGLAVGRLEARRRRLPRADTLFKLFSR